MSMILPDKAPPSSRRVSPGVSDARVVEPNREELTAFLLGSEPPRLGPSEFRTLIMSAVASGASDITFQSDQQPRGEIHGILYRLMNRPLAPSEIDFLLADIYGGANASTEINGRNVLDFSYEENLSDGQRQRFRVNATGIHGRTGSGIEITMRVLPTKTPDLAMVQITQAEIEALTPREGLVVIAGGTGSGKSTTMAAITRYHLENSVRPTKIVDIQAPIEYTFRDVTSAMTGSSSMIGQSEVGRHIRSFSQGVHSALRRKPNIINVGEARDYETISASLEASQTGHLVYTTTHAGSVSDTIRRLLSTFPANEREARAYDLISTLRFVIVQHLLPRIDKIGRVPVREYLRITQRVRDKLINQPVNAWPAILNLEVSRDAEDRGSDDMRKSLLETCRQLFLDGVISEADAKVVCGINAVRAES